MRKRINKDPELVASSNPARYSEKLTDKAYIDLSWTAWQHGLITKATFLDRVQKKSTKYKEYRLMDMN